MGHEARAYAPKKAKDRTGLVHLCGRVGIIHIQREACLGLTEMEDTSPARVCQSLFQLVMESGGGMIPETGQFSAVVWGKLIGVEANTIRKWVKKHRIPYRQPGAEMFIEAGDFSRHIPYFSQEE